MWFSGFGVKGISCVWGVPWITDKRRHDIKLLAQADPGHSMSWPISGQEKAGRLSGDWLRTSSTPCRRRCTPSLGHKRSGALLF